MKQALALLINDIHVDKDNIEEFNKNWDEAIKVCQCEGVVDMVVGGDMFTSRSSQTLSVLLAVKRALLRATTKGITVTLAEGNHDKVNQEEIEGYNHIFAGLKGVDVIDNHEALYWEGAKCALLVVCYFPENGSFLDKLDTAITDAILKLNPDVNSENQIVLYIHEGVHGALGEFDIDGELPQEPFENFHKVLCGHYHNRVRIKNTNIEYIGSSRQHNFGEDEEKGYTLFYDDGSTKFVKNEVNTRYATHEISFKELSKLSLQPKDNYKYKLKVRCTEKQSKDVDKQALLEMGYNKVELVVSSSVSAETSASSIDEKYDINGIKKEYVNFCNEQSIDSSLGIKYLEE